MKNILMLLPMLHREWVNIDNDGEPTDLDSHWQGRAWIIEWFGHGYIFYINEVRAARGE